MEPVATSELTKGERDKATHLAARHGNYHQYYKFREDKVPDDRLAILPPGLLSGARVLDLGCNAGKITYEAMQCCGASASVGVDLDPVLIDQALAQFPNGPCTFEHFDFMNTKPYTNSAAGTFDVVLLLSVTKWIHLNAGDVGMISLFAYVHSILNPNGHLVVEPQPWSNYARAAKRCAALRPVFKQIKMRPPFTKELINIGFERVMEKDRQEEGFERSVHVWRKR